MAEITAQMVKELRAATGSGIMDCKRVLAEADGDMDNAIDLLRKKGLAKAAKRAGRSTSEGIIYSYIHTGAKLGVLLEVNCESDFVAKTEDFEKFAKDIAMHIAAANPAGLVPEDVDQSVIEKEREIYRAQMLEEGKPENIIDKIVDGKVEKFYKEVCLLSQQYIKDPQKTVEDVLKETIGKIGENIQIKRFARFQIGE
ncbi:MAG TPA: elongation factor Ts [Desulfobacter sp.]|jgi:elongation factor Ts|uniref:translation elongation factor Ts n=2 Tax=unclassified Desulfobacter TaxID=2634406 RepID=UPI000E87F57C|nr:translation elongation factor Ts [Desulfobacter sp.]MDQ1269626.1 elongation factor Ts [Thermodesulfobacteriota bacterium]HRF90506.1 translation elongation factor Ts [Desulfobacter postgatei]MBP8829035.1 translation elongation factor Ts [Desulfobacter sp.]MBP9598383.1 translation elongation factor Ts [Desulfobacter sp.]HAR35171.1 elongation factor Ts [Desulfobacter sp.]